MSKAHELTLLGKWSESVLPPLSPTSPKATKFCCCPNRRRYNIKQPKAKSTLDARNIFLGNDFTYIDDATEETVGNTPTENSTTNGSRKGYKAYIGESHKDNEVLESLNRVKANEKNTNEIEVEEEQEEVYSDAVDTFAFETPINCEGTEQRCDKQKQCQHSNNNNNNNNNNKKTRINCSNTENSFVTKRASCDNENVATSSNISASTLRPTINECRNDIRNDQKRQQQQQRQQIQRLSNSETNNCNNHKETQNIHQKSSDCHCYSDITDDTKATTTTTTTTGLNNSSSDYCPRQQLATTPTKIDSPNTMTITTTTNVASRKNSECGLTITTPKPSSSATIAQIETESSTAMPIMTTTATTTTTTTAVTPTTPRPLTPSLTTVIKTTMVKRSPANESTSAPTTPTAMTANIAMASDYNDNEESIASQATNGNHSGRSSYKSNEPTTRSVRERIAALVAGSGEQLKQLHDNSIRTQPQCNKNQGNMTIARTQNAQSAINSLHHSRQPVISANRSDGSNSGNCNNNNKSNNNHTNATYNVSLTTQKSTPNATTTTTTASPSSPISSSSASSIQSSPSSSSSSASSASASLARSSFAQALSSINDIPPRRKSGLNDAQRVSFATTSTSADDAAVQAALLAANTGCATLPRRRSTASSLMAGTNERNVLKHGSNTGANMTLADKNCATSMQPIITTTTTSRTNGTTANVAAATSTSSSLSPSESTSRKLAALDNLDLALNLDLTDDDGEDPYYALQEYLERVKHEINEVFELHKARQRMQQEQEKEQQLQLQQQQSELSHAAVLAPTTTASNDELSRSTESDSGFDSASGGLNNMTTTGSHTNNSNNDNSELRIRSTANMEQPTTEICCSLGINEQHASPFLKTNTAATLNNHKQQTMSQNRKPTTPETTATTTTANSSTTEEQTNRRNTKLKALPPPPLSPIRITPQQQSNAASEDVNIWANKFLRDLDNLMANNNSNSTNNDKPSTSSSSVSSSPTSSTTSPMLLSAAAKAAIQSRYGKGASSLTTTTTTTTDHREQSTTGNSSVVLVRPEKHATIPLQSFNLDCGRLDTGSGSGSSNGCGGGNIAPTKSSIAYMRTLSAPTPYHQYSNMQQQQQRHDNKIAGNANGKTGNNRNSLAAFNTTSDLQHALLHQQNLTNFQSKNAATTTSSTDEATLEPTTLLKIEETTAASGCRTATAAAAADALDITSNSSEESLKRRRQQQQQRQMETDMETVRNSLAAIEAIGGYTGSDKNMAVASIPKRERINHATTTSLIAANAHGGSNGTTSKPTATTTASMVKTQSGAGSPSPASYLLNSSEATKKGSTSTIWTSEESILRSVGAVDEDNNSTSSSACEEASGVLSSGKSGISLDSSGLDNDNNESGIGTATPPKDLAYWRSLHHNDNESISSLDALRKTKFQKSSSVASSDDPDLLEVLSLCDEPRNGGTGDEDIDESHDDIDDRHTQTVQSLQQRQTTTTTRYPHHPHYHHHHSHHHRQRRQLENKNNDSLSSRAPIEAIEATEESIILDETTAMHAEDDEGHDEFETVPYCDCDCTDGDVSSASGSAPNGSPNATMHDTIGNGGGGSGVVLRRKYPATPIMVPYSAGGRRQKSRSHSLDTSSLPSTYHSPNNHQQQQQQQQQLHQHHYPSHHHLGQSQLSRKLHHLQTNRSKERCKLSLALRQEPFQSLLAPAHFHELPSPSSASLHSGHEGLGIQELTTKSNSAPLLLKQEKQKREDFVGQKSSLRYSRSQSDRYLAEIEAVEACKWLRAAGFPQYAQMYEDHQFPIDLTNVAKDHTNLENDQLQSLYRRLSTLNRCANMRLDQTHKPQTPQKEDSDDENFALSENWTFQPHIRRWSRIGEGGLELPPAGKLNAEKTESSSKESSPDRFEDDAYDIGGAMLSLTLPGANDLADGSETGDDAVRLRRTGSERLKDGAKALLRRVESIKSRRRKRQNRDGLVISGHQALDLSQLGQRSSVRKPDAVYSTPPSPSAVSPMHTFPTKSPFFGNELKVPSQSEHFLSPNRASPKRTPTTPRSMRTSPLHFFSNAMPHLREGKSDDSSSYYSDSQESSTGGKLSLSLRKTPSKTRRFLQRTGKVDDIGAHSDSECHHGRKLLIKDANANTTEKVKIKKLTRGGSLNLGKDPKKREGFRSSSFRSRSTSRKETKPEDADNVKKSPVVRWHSFQMEERPHMIFRKCFAQKIDPQQTDQGTPFSAMSAGQLQIIRKLALVILTGHMERYCPTHRSGWNWELPKFIKKMKLPPDYKDKRVFGVPLLLILQRTGQTLPMAVRAAFRWLQLNALDQIGLFRKSGVKSRILRLKELIEVSESTAECMEVFDSQQAYDVADMLKQYFRDLPESLLTTKMSETFVAIFQHLPPEVRLDAIQCAVLLLPDENREILYALLEFLTLVASNAKFNQMTANNLAVCLAPSLFHNSISTGAASVSASPRRRNKGGMPDNKELSEAKASHECLAFMVENYRQIFTANKEKIHKCNFGYMEESKPVQLEALGEGMQFHNWRGYLYECTSFTIKEGREKTRGWFTITSQTDPNVEVAYKKVGDGHPLRLWRCITEVEGPPREVLDYIIKQRASWDPHLLECQTVKTLDERTEIYQYALDGQVTTDFCVLRSWQTDLPRGACVIVETSIDHNKAKPMFGAVRGVVLASRYLIEPCGSGKSRVMHLARVDVKGKTPEWYNKSFGHLCSHYLAKIRADFKHITDGPESKV